MKIRLNMKDIEYRDELARAISLADRDMYAEITDEMAAEKDSMFVTDDPEILKYRGLESEGYTLVYISDCIEDRNIETPGPFILFKFEQLSVMLQELILCNYLATGRGLQLLGEGRAIGICQDGSCSCGNEFTRGFARNLAFSSDKKVLLISLRYVNTYGTKEGDKLGLHKLIYHFSRNDSLPVDVFFWKDNYDVYYLKGDDGWNFIVDLSFEEMGELVTRLRNSFDFVIFDIGECYSRVNIRILDGCRNVFLLSRDESTELYERVVSVVLDGRNNSRVRAVQADKINAITCAELVREYLEHEMEV